MLPSAQLPIISVGTLQLLQFGSLKLGGIQTFFLCFIFKVSGTPDRASERRYKNRGKNILLSLIPLIMKGGVFGQLPFKKKHEQILYAPYIDNDFLVQMQYRPMLATLSIILFSAIIALIVLMNLAPVTELFIALIGALVVAIIGAGWWGFRDKIEDKKENADFYSPIHAMIVRINSKVSRQLALQGTVGVWVNAKDVGIDYQIIAETFSQNMTKFKNEDLKKWIEIEQQIKAYVNGGGFFVGRDTQEWFDDLESRYIH